jgi:hypothetical protein
MAAQETVPEADYVVRSLARAERLRMFVTEVERSATGEFGLCDPIEADWLGEYIADTDAHQFALRWFNPFGPTHLEFVLKALPGRSEALFIANQRHPFAPKTWALGLLEPRRFHTGSELVAVVAGASTRRRAGEACRWIAF